MKLPACILQFELLRKAPIYAIVQEKQTDHKLFFPRLHLETFFSYLCHSIPSQKGVSHSLKDVP